MKLVTIQEANSRVLGLVERLVAERFKETGSRITAAEDIAAAVGKSASWLRKLRSGSAGAVVTLADAMNVATAYDRLCSRIEAAAETEKARAAALRRNTDAAVSSALDLVDGKARAPGRSEGLRFRKAAKPAVAPRPRRAAREAAQHLNCPALGRV
ncbi:hypothetical protein [uncultured Methylobacterium sp.]|uniref:hypothetical protein n=1 Tax=uncultured Methylobacterium sp. TaxID=157278 RepID=UPI0035C95474